MDRLEGLALHLVPEHVCIGAEHQDRVSEHVLHELRGRVGPLGNILLVLPFEQGIDLAARHGFELAHEVLDPVEHVVGVAYTRANHPALVVRSALGDLLAARAKRGNGNLHAENKVEAVVRESAGELAVVVQRADTL